MTNDNSVDQFYAATWSLFTLRLTLDRYFGACVIVFAVALTTEAQADCALTREAFSSCQIEGQNTEVFVCHDDQVATYSYGPIGAPVDLFLLETIENVDFEPWSGVGKAISESVTFYNGEFSYEIGAGFDRPFSEEEMLQKIRRFGWIEIAQNGQSLGRLECIPDTVSYYFGGGIYDAKVAVGLVWDYYSETRLPDPKIQRAGPIQKSLLMTGIYLGVIEECLPPAELKLGSIELGYSVADLSKLVPPVVGEVITSSVLEIERFMYEGLRMDAYQGKIIELQATSPFWEMPSGLKVGITHGEVISILGHVPSGADATSQKFGLIARLGNQDSYPVWYVVISFGQDKRVQSISFASL